MLDRLRQMLDALLAVLVLSHKALRRQEVALSVLPQVVAGWDKVADSVSAAVVAGWDKVAVSVSASARQLLGWEAPPS